MGIGVFTIWWTRLFTYNLDRIVKIDFFIFWIESNHFKLSKDRTEFDQKLSKNNLYI